MQKGTKPFLKSLGEKLRGNKKLELLVYGGIALIVVACYAFSFLPEKTQTPDVADGASLGTGTEAELEEKLRRVLGSIRGAGQVEVMITYETGTELVTAMTTDVNSNLSETETDGHVSSQTQTVESSQPATVSSGGGEAPIVLLEREPVIRGVIVVAEGAADVGVRLDLQRAVRAVLHIPVSQIEVFELSAERVQ